MNAPRALRLLRLPLALCLSFFGLAALAQSAAPAPGLPAPAPALDAAPPAGGAAEPFVQRTVIEDRNARVDELRVRGELRTITVSPTLPGARAYQVLPPAPGRPFAEGPGSQRGAAGQRVWSVISF